MTIIVTITVTTTITVMVTMTITITLTKTVAAVITIIVTIVIMIMMITAKICFFSFLFFYLGFNLDQYASTGMVVTLPKTPKQVKVDVDCSFLYFLWFSGNFILIWFEEPNRYKNSEEVLVDYEISHFLTT